MMFLFKAFMYLYLDTRNKACNVTICFLLNYEIIIIIIIRRRIQLKFPKYIDTIRILFGIIREDLITTRIR